MPRTTLSACSKKWPQRKPGIVSLTITESGYYLNHGTGGFDEHHPDIVRDLEHPHQPRCSFGYMAEALDRRRRLGLTPFTVLSCDNLQQNGDVASSSANAAGVRGTPRSGAERVDGKALRPFPTAWWIGSPP